MVRAAIKEKNATSPAERKKHHENYQAFLFLYANSLLHEIGHLFITYLSRGQQSCHTPTNMKVPTIFDKHPEIGEAGRKLEALVFGGTMEYMVDPDKNFDWYDVCSHIIALVQGQLVEIQADTHSSAARLTWSIRTASVRSAAGEFCRKQSRGLSSAVSNPAHDSLSHPVPFLINHHLSEFEFPYDHEKDEEKRKLEAIDPEPGMVKFMDPMGYRPPWHPYVNSFSDPAEFFSVLCGDPSN